MKIAIKANPSRGKEIISLFKSLGGINSLSLDGSGVTAVYYIDNDSIMRYGDAPKDYKVYTLEEFETQFPFKIGDEVVFPAIKGWLSGKITGIKDLKYEVDTRTGGYRYVEPYKLQLYPMKKERNITLTLEKAKEWYKKGGDLKQVALQAFTEEELTKLDLPKTWEEFCMIYPVQTRECWLDKRGIIQEPECSGSRKYKNWIPSRKSAEAHLAMMQLEQLRDCWRQGNIPQQLKYKIRKVRNIYTVVYGAEDSFLSFCDKQTAEEFLECFRSLIEQAGDLI